MPVLNPAELWRRSGRYGIDEVFKLQDRRGADMVLAMTHEEVVTFHVSQIVRSYRQLPFSLYHFQTKERDEPRPRAGVLRTREFIMKDAYTFDRDRDGLDAHYERYREAYDRVFDRVGLEWYRVESDVGAMGGLGAHEYMAPSAAGENDVALAPGFAANVEVASALAQPVALPAAARRARAGRDAGHDHDRRRRRASRPARGRRCSRPSRSSSTSELRLVMLRGDHRVNEIKLRNALGSDFRPAHPEEVERIGPAGLPRTGRRGRPHPARRRRGGRRLRRRRQPARHACARRRAGARLRLRDRRRPQRRGRRYGERPPDPDRAGDRGRQHLQAGHALLRAVQRDVPGRERARAADLDGLLRDRAGTDRRGGGRAVRRRAGDRLAAGDRAVRRRARRARQAGQRRARAGRAALRRAARGRAWT